MMNFYTKFSASDESFDLIFLYYFICRRENKHVNVPFWRIRPLYFPSKNLENAAYEGRDGLRELCFPPNSAFFPL